MKAFIIEDEPMAQANLIRTLNHHFPDIEIIGTARSIQESVEWLKDPSHRAELIFMDVELSDGECFKIFRQVEVHAKVIMTTAYDHYALKSFEAGSIDYLLKPIDPKDLGRAIERCRERSGEIDVERLMEKLGKAEKSYKERYIIRLNDRIIPIRTADIAYFYSEDKNNYIVTKDDSTYLINATLDVIIEELDPKQFFKISRSCIIAIDAISSITRQQGGKLRIVPLPECDFEMTVSRSKVDEFLIWIE